MDRRERRAWSPSLERVEARNLLSTMGTIALNRPGLESATLNALLAQRHASTGALAADSSGLPAGGSGMSSVPIVPSSGQPTPRELAREAFKAYFHGPVYYGPPRFSDQKQIFYIRGTGGSNQFLHGDFQMAIVVPTDPSAPITGAAVMQDKNTNSGGLLGLDLVAVPNAFDRLGRPTRFTFTSDPNIYGGTYYASTSTGTVKVAYLGNTATATFQGRVYNSGLTDPLRNSDLIGRGGKVAP